MDWTAIIIAFITGGGLMSLFTLRQTKEGKDIENASNLVKEYTELLERYKADAGAASKKVEELSQQVNDLRVQVASMESQLKTAQLLYENATAIKCELLDCARRRPPLNKKKIEKLAGERSKVEIETPNN